VTAAAVWGVGKLGLNLSSEDVAGIVGPLTVYVLGQGIADSRKPPTPAEIKAQIDAMAAGPQRTVDSIEKAIRDGKLPGGIGTSP
jgi:hypothetical protein